MSDVPPAVRADLQELESRIQTLAQAVYDLAGVTETIARSTGETFAASQASSAQSKASGLR